MLSSDCLPRCPDRKPTRCSRRRCAHLRGACLGRRPLLLRRHHVLLRPRLQLGHPALHVPQPQRLRHDRPALADVGTVHRARRRRCRHRSRQRLAPPLLPLHDRPRLVCPRLRRLPVVGCGKRRARGRAQLQVGSDGVRRPFEHRGVGETCAAAATTAVLEGEPLHGRADHPVGSLRLLGVRRHAQRAAPPVARRDDGGLPDHLPVSAAPPRRVRVRRVDDLRRVRRKHLVAAPVRVRSRRRSRGGAHDQRAVGEGDGPDGGKVGAENLAAQRRQLNVCGAESPQVLHVRVLRLCVQRARVDKAERVGRVVLVGRGEVGTCADAEERAPRRDEVADCLQACGAERLRLRHAFAARLNQHVEAALLQHAAGDVVCGDAVCFELADAPRAGCEVPCFEAVFEVGCAAGVRHTALGRAAACVVVERNAGLGCGPHGACVGVFHCCTHSTSHSHTMKYRYCSF
eukprot:Rhum_TRINITY_DN918_c0_g1::Rhum_TRINITY_DN918_c0_g1_i1::g.2729::m.2729